MRVKAAPIRIGLAGAGWVTEHHLDAYRELRDRAEVVAIADPRVDVARARAERYGIPAVYHSVEAMLAQERLDALDIAAPREHHVPLCRLAAHHDLAILCQKPLAPTLEEAEELVAELGIIPPETDPEAVSGVEPEAPQSAEPGAPPSARARLMVHDNWRFRPHYRRMHEWLGQGRIGATRGAFMTLLSSGLLPDDEGNLPALVRQPMLADLERMLLMEVMIHHVDTLRFLLGPLELAAARLGRRCEQIRGEDRAALFLSTADGAPVTLLGDFMAHGHPAEQRDRLEILGTEGSIVLRDGTLRLVAGAAAPGAASPTPGEAIELDLQADYKASYRGAIAHFLDRLADGAPFETSAPDNLETLKIVEAAYRTGLAS